MRTVFIIFILLQYVSAREYSFADLLNAVQKNSIELKIYKKDIQIQKISIKEAKSAYWPQITLNGYSEYNRDLSENDSGVQSVGNDVITNDTMFQNALSLKLNYLLYDFGIRSKKTDVEKIKYSIKKLELCTRMKSLSEKLLDLYKKALADYIYISYYEKLNSLQKEIYNYKLRLYKAGEISKIELADSAIEILNMENNLKNKKEDYENILFEISKITNLKITLKDRLKDFNTKAPTASLNFEQSAKYRIITLKIKQKEKELDIAKRNFLPVFSFYASYNMYGGDRSYIRSVENVRQDSYKAGLSFQINLFDGNLNSYKKKKIILEIQKLELERKLNKKEFENKIVKIKKNIEYLNSINQKNFILNKNLSEENNMNMRLKNVKKIDLITYLEKKIKAQKQKMEIRIKNVELGYYLEKLKLGEGKCILH